MPVAAPVASSLEHERELKKKLADFPIFFTLENDYRGVHRISESESFYEDGHYWAATRVYKDGQWLSALREDADFLLRIAHPAADPEALVATPAPEAAGEATVPDWIDNHPDFEADDDDDDFHDLDDPHKKYPDRAFEADFAVAAHDNATVRQVFEALDNDELMSMTEEQFRAHYASFDAQHPFVVQLVEAGIPLEQALAFIYARLMMLASDTQGFPYPHQLRRMLKMRWSVKVAKAGKARAASSSVVVKPVIRKKGAAPAPAPAYEEGLAEQEAAEAVESVPRDLAEPDDAGRDESLEDEAGDSIVGRSVREEDYVVELYEAQNREGQEIASDVRHLVKNAFEGAGDPPSYANVKAIVKAVDARDIIADMLIREGIFDKKEAVQHVRAAYLDYAAQKHGISIAELRERCGLKPAGFLAGLRLVD